MKKLRPGKICNLAIEILKHFKWWDQKSLLTLVYTVRSCTISHNKKQGGLHHRVLELWLWEFHLVLSISKRTSPALGLHLHLTIFRKRMGMSHPVSPSQWWGIAFLISLSYKRCDSEREFHIQNDWVQIAVLPLSSRVSFLGQII